MYASMGASFVMMGRFVALQGSFVALRGNTSVLRGKLYGDVLVLWLPPTGDTSDPDDCIQEIYGENRSCYGEQLGCAWACMDVAQRLNKQAAYNQPGFGIRTVRIRISMGPLGVCDCCN